MSHPLHPFFDFSRARVRKNDSQVAFILFALFFVLSTYNSKKQYEKSISWSFALVDWTCV